MAAILYLNEKQVFPDTSLSIKLTKENPYFTQSDSYTLDVTLPMDILENRKFFNNVNRLQVSKKVQRMSCRLIVDNRPLLSGSAKITQISDKEVKVQLFGGNSEINFLSEDENNYIDNLPLGKIIMEEVGTTEGFGRRKKKYKDTGIVDTGIRCKNSVIYDETLQEVKGCHQYAFLDICKQIFESFGLSVTECCLDQLPWSELFVASAKATRTVAHVLPHWSLKTFIDEFCKFFNVSVIINQEKKTVCIKDNATFFKGQEQIKIAVTDDYTAELNEESDAHALSADNICFDLSNSEHHDYDSIPENVRDNAYSEEYDSLNDAQSAYLTADEEDKKGTIFVCPEGKYTGWLHDYSDVGGEEEKLLFTQIDVFAPLVRDKENENETELKICPVAFYERTSSIWKGHIPSMANPTGDEYNASGFGGSRTPEDESPSIQEYVMGEANIEKEEKEDRLQVMFIDDIEQPYFTYMAARSEWTEGYEIIGFTDYQYKKAHKGNMHNPWSLSLNRTNATHYLGQLHDNGFSFNIGAKVCVKFLSKSIPDPTKIFIINNKRYGCEKIEAQIDSQGLNGMMTGYFYEMTK